MTWAATRLDAIASIQTGPFGSQLHQEDYVEVGTPIITVEHLGGYRITRENLPMVSEDDAERLRKYSLLPGDVVFSRVGSVDQSSFVTGDEEGWLFSGRCLRVRPHLDEVDPMFVYYALNTSEVKSFITAIAVGATMPSINTALLSEVQIPSPPIAQQRRISSILGSLDDKIAANNEVKRLTDEMIQSLWRKLINEDSSFMEFGDVVQLNPRTTARRGSRLTTIEMKNLPESGFSVDTWTVREAKGGSRYRNGDTLLARITPCFENGKCGYVDFLEPEEVGAGSTEFIVLRPRAGVPTAAPYAIARSPEFRTFAAQTMTGTSGRQRVQPRDLETHEIAWPSEDLIADFEAKTSPLLDLAGKLRDENRNLAKTRDELLPLLMSGKITVKEAEQEATAAGADIASEENKA